MKISLVITASILASSLAYADDVHHHPKPIPKDLSELSSKLVGTWEGKSDEDPKAGTLKVIYEPTSGGSALVEKLGPGTDHEMLSIYTSENGKLAMTHYCMLGNQPHMVLKSSSPNQYTFEFVKTAGINPKKDGYMGALTLTFLGKDSLKEDWSYFEAGKKQHTTSFVLAKKK